jgi:hypothetical protein
MDRIDPLLRAQSRSMGNEPERLRLQRVSRQHGHGFSIDLVAGGPPPPEVVIIHAGQVIVNEGVGMDALQSRAQREGPPGLPAQRLTEGQRHHGSHPLAAGQQAVAHGLL